MSVKLTHRIGRAAPKAEIMTNGDLAPFFIMDPDTDDANLLFVVCSRQGYISDIFETNSTVAQLLELRKEPQKLGKFCVDNMTKDNHLKRLSAGHEYTKSLDINGKSIGQITVAHMPDVLMSPFEISRKGLEIPPKPGADLTPKITLL